MLITRKGRFESECHCVCFLLEPDHLFDNAITHLDSADQHQEVEYRSFFMQITGRRFHACSLEPPHPAEPPNAVTRSRRKYHSVLPGSAIQFSRCLGRNIYPSIFLRVTKAGASKRKKEIIIYFRLFSRCLSQIRDSRCLFSQLGRICSSPITATINAILDGPEKNIFFHRYFSLTYNGLDKWLFQKEIGNIFFIYLSLKIAPHL